MCTRCKLVLAHTILAMVGSEIKRVQCNTCRSTRVFRPVARAKNGRSSGQVSREPRSVSSNGTAGAKNRSLGAMAHHYEALMQGRRSQVQRSYSVKERFGEGEVLNHVTFGVGLVTAYKDSNKIEVLFASGAKTLIHAGPPEQS
jgi:hypothetical protein